ncbi:hypothetical protein VTI74DRAFT_2780 [Chaetomium olivicolor]
MNDDVLPIARCSLCFMGMAALLVIASVESHYNWPKGCREGVMLHAWWQAAFHSV